MRRRVRGFWSIIGIRGGRIDKQGRWGYQGPFGELLWCCGQLSLKRCKGKGTGNYFRRKFCILKEFPQGYLCVDGFMFDMCERLHEEKSGEFFGRIIARDYGLIKHYI